jgi:hypothetical protein
MYKKLSNKYRKSGKFSYCAFHSFPPHQIPAFKVNSPRTLFPLQQIPTFKVHSSHKHFREENDTKLQLINYQRTNWIKKERVRANTMFLHCFSSLFPSLFIITNFRSLCCRLLSWGAENGWLWRFLWVGFWVLSLIFVFLMVFGAFFPIMCRIFIWVWPYFFIFRIFWCIFQLKIKLSIKYWIFKCVSNLKSVVWVNFGFSVFFFQLKIAFFCIFSTHGCVFLHFSTTYFLNLDFLAISSNALKYNVLDQGSQIF